MPTASRGLCKGRYGKFAGMTRESRARMSEAAAAETLRMLAGERPRNFVNPQSWERRRT